MLYKVLHCISGVQDEAHLPVAYKHQGRGCYHVQSQTLPYPDTIAQSSTPLAKNRQLGYRAPKMKITMVKKILRDGSPCNKCAQAESILRKRGHWDQIDRVVYIREGEEDSEGVKLARSHSIEVAPFFIVHENSEAPRVYTRLFEFINRELAPDASPSFPPPRAPRPNSADVCNQDTRLKPNTVSKSEASTAERTYLTDIESANREYSTLGPSEILAHAQGNFGKNLTLAFSGAEDVILIDIASRNNLPFSVFCLDTGRLHPETYTFIEEVRRHYGIAIEIFTPSPALLQPFLSEKGINSFYQDGHAECCGIRKVEPLGRALKNYRVWATGLRRDQSPETRSHLRYVEIDRQNTSLDGRPLIKMNPLLDLSSKQVWEYIRTNKVPYNLLHDVGFQSIGCQPCTRPLRPGEHERAARWWWENETKRECGIHL